MTNKEAIKFLKIEVNRWEYDCKSLQPMKEAITLAIKSLENEPKKGKWITKNMGYLLFEECDQCHCNVGTINMNFCPNCGADMRGDKNG